MAQYDKLINLGLLSQFLTKAKTIFAPKITASGILKGDGAGNVSAATAGTDYATPAQSLALGLTGASVGDLVRVNAVDANGKPTSWKKVQLNEIKCNKNYLINHYMGGGGSQRTDKQNCLPINQRGQSTYTNTGYGLDMWKVTHNGGSVIIGTDYVELENTSSNHFRIAQHVATIPNGIYTLSALITEVVGDVYLRCDLVKSPYTNYHYVKVSQGLIWSSDTLSHNGAEIMVDFQLTPQSSIKFQDVKLELGSEQTLAHNEGTAENPVWVLNELSNYEEELRKCKLYFERIGGTYNTFGSGTGDSNNRAAFLTYVSPKSSAFTGRTDKVPSANISASGTFYINGSGIDGKNAPVTNVFAYKELTYNGTFRFQADTSGSLTTGYGYTIQSKNTAAYIDISCEP